MHAPCPAHLISFNLFIMSVSKAWCMYSMVDKSAGDYSGSLFLTDNGQDMTKKNCCNDCDKLKREL